MFLKPKFFRDFGSERAIWLSQNESFVLIREITGYLGVLYLDAHKGIGDAFIKWHL